MSNICLFCEREIILDKAYIDLERKSTYVQTLGYVPDKGEKIGIKYMCKSCIGILYSILKIEEEDY